MVKAKGTFVPNWKNGKWDAGMYSHTDVCWTTRKKCLQPQLLPMQRIKTFMLDLEITLDLAHIISHRIFLTTLLFLTKSNPALKRRQRECFGTDNALQQNQVQHFLQEKNSFVFGGVLLYLVLVSLQSCQTGPIKEGCIFSHKMLCVLTDKLKIGWGVCHQYYYIEFCIISCNSTHNISLQIIIFS